MLLHCKGSSRGHSRRAGLTTTVQPQEQEQRRSHALTDNAKPRATERSEGGSRSRKPVRRAILTEQIVVRVSKTMVTELEDYAVMNELQVSDVARRAIHQFLNPPERPRYQAFEESP